MNTALNLLLENSAVLNAIKQIKDDEALILEEQKYLCAIPSPSNHEEKRAAAYYEMFSQLPFDKVWQDEVNNVFGLLKGTGDGPTIMIAAHMDTVFDFDVDVTPWVDEHGIIHAPGIADDTRGMVEVLAIARAMLNNNIRAIGDIIFCGDVGEETAGDLRGMRHIFATQKNIDAFISVDGSEVESLHINAVASRKIKITFTGTGGHALRMFGYPNANIALGRCVALIGDLTVPSDPFTIFNVGLISGGTSVNAIPTEASVILDIRSLSEDVLDQLEKEIKQIGEKACIAENNRWNHPSERVNCSFEITGKRPGGFQSTDSAIVKAAVAVYKLFGTAVEIPKGTSTDANLPISLGVPAIAVGRGGSIKYGHTVNEEYNPENGHIGPQRNIALLLLLGGYKDVCSPFLLK